MAKTKRCKNDKMKKRNKTQKYVKSGGLLTNIRGKKKSHDKFQYLEKTGSQILKMTPDDLIHNITSNLNVMKQEHNHILEHLDDLFYNLVNNYKYDKSKFGDDIKQWCNFYNKPLTQYKTMKEEIHALQQKNPSLVSLIQEIQKKIKVFEEENEHFKYVSCNPLPPLPVGRPRASTPQEAAPSPPPRGRKPGSGEYAKLGSNRMTKKISMRKPSTLKPLKRSPYEDVVPPISVIKARQNSPYENASQFRKSSSSKGYNQFDPTNPFYTSPSDRNK